MPVKEAVGESGEARPSLISRIKTSIFGRGKVPEKTELMITSVESVDELRRSLDDEITENEVNAGQLERELEKLGVQIDEHKDHIRGGGLSERAKITALRAIKRLQTKIKSYERRLKILQDNIDIHFTILNQIDEMEAMEMKAIKREQIDEIAVDYEERSEKHRDFVDAVRSSVSEQGYEDLQEQQELAELEASIMAELEAPVAEAAAEPLAEAEVASRRPSLDAPIEAVEEAREEAREDAAPRRELELE